MKFIFSIFIFVFLKNLNSTFIVDISGIQVLEPKNCYCVKNNAIHSLETMEKLKNAKSLKLGLEVAPDINESSKQFSSLALQGDPEAQFWLGVISSEQNDYASSIRWCVLSFQNIWFNNPQLAYSSNAFKFLENFPIEEKKYYDLDINFIKLIYPKNLMTNESKFFRYHALIQFYSLNTAEPYLNAQENDLKIKRILYEINFIQIDNSQITLKNQFLFDALKIIERSRSQSQSGEKQAVLNLCIKAICNPQADYIIGCLYEKGELDFQIDYREAADRFLKSATVDSFYRLGKLYMNSLINSVPQEPDYSRAFKYFQYSGNSDALTDIGIMFKLGCITTNSSLEIDYQSAFNYFKKAQTTPALLYMADMLFFGQAGLLLSGRPNYEEVRNCCQKAVDQSPDNVEANLKLAGTYLLDEFNHLEDYPNYTKAKEYLQHILQLPCPIATVRKIYNILGTIYVHDNNSEIDPRERYSRAVECFDKSQSHESLFAIAMIYYQGNLLTPNGKTDHETAYDYFARSKAARSEFKVD